MDVQLRQDLPDQGPELLHVLPRVPLRRHIHVQGLLPHLRQGVTAVDPADPPVGPGPRPPYTVPIQLVYLADHHPMDQVVREIGGGPTQVQGPRPGELVIDLRRGLFQLHGDQLLPLRDLAGELERPHHVQDAVRLPGSVPLVRGAAQRILLGQEAPDLLMGEDPARGDAAEETVDAVGDPGGAQDAQVFREGIDPFFVSVVVRHAQVLGPVQQSPLDGGILDMVAQADLTVLVRVDVAFPHLFQFLFDADHVGVGPGPVDAVRHGDLDRVDEIRHALFPLPLGGGLEDTAQIAVDLPQGPLVHGHAAVEIGLVEGQDHGTARGEGAHGLHPAGGVPVDIGVVADLTHDHVDGVGGEERAAHGVQDLRSAEVQDPETEVLLVDGGVPGGDLHAAGGEGALLELVGDDASDQGALAAPAVP